MGCNCASKEQIERLHKLYGEKIDEKNKKLKFRLKNFLTNLSIGFLMIFIIPYLFFYVLYNKFFKDGKISIREFIGMERGVDDAYLNYVKENNDFPISNN